jgi:hypothetical protein
MQLYVDDNDLRRIVGEGRAMDALGEATAHLGSTWKERQLLMMETVVGVVREIVPKGMEISSLTVSLELSGKVCGSGLAGKAELTLIPERLAGNTV